MPSVKAPNWVHTNDPRGAASDPPDRRPLNRHGHGHGHVHVHGHGHGHGHGAWVMMMMMNDDDE